MPVIKRSEQRSRSPFEGAVALAMAGADSGSKFLTVAELTVEPGRKSAYHIHPNTEESIYVIEGEMEMGIAGEVRTLKPGDMYIIPGGVEHYAKCGAIPVKALDIFSPVRTEFQY